MKLPAAQRTTDAAEAREREKARKALAKWIPHRRAALAYHGAVDLPETTDAVSIVLGLLEPTKAGE